MKAIALLVIATFSNFCDAQFRFDSINSDCTNMKGSSISIDQILGRGYLHSWNKQLPKKCGYFDIVKSSTNKYLFHFTYYAENKENHDFALVIENANKSGEVALFDDILDSKPAIILEVISVTYGGYALILCPISELHLVPPMIGIFLTTDRYNQDIVERLRAMMSNEGVEVGHMWQMPHTNCQQLN